MTGIRFSGFGGQGIVRCGLITGKALALYEGKYATMTQSFGPEARGSACSSQLVVSNERILYPYITTADILVCLSREAYGKYEPGLSPTGILIVDADLVQAAPPRDQIQKYSIGATRMAETLGNRIVANLVILGFFTAVTAIVTPGAMLKALPGLVPDRHLELNERAFQRGYEYGMEKSCKADREIS